MAHMKAMHRAMPALLTAQYAGRRCSAVLINEPTSHASSLFRAEGDNDDLDNTNKSFQEGAFATLYTLTKNRQLDASVRLAVLKVVLEFLQASGRKRAGSQQQPTGHVCSLHW
jgi:hypothetical protein